MEFEVIKEPYRMTKQELVKLRHQYANQLAGGLFTKGTTVIKIKLSNEIIEVKTETPAKWLDRLFQELMSGHLRGSAAKKIIADYEGPQHLTLDEIKKLRIRVEESTKS